MKLTVTEMINKKDEQAIFDGLRGYNRSQMGDISPEDLAVYLKDDEGNMCAGLIGFTFGNWLTVKYLWVASDLRKQNIGSKLLRESEKEAMDRGCKYSFLDTFSFQAPKFYQKHGYEIACILEEYPIIGERYYLTKELKSD